MRKSSRGGLGPQARRERADPREAVARDGLEVVERHDAVRPQGVERGEEEDPSAGGPAAERDRRTRHPGQPLVGEADRRVPTQPLRLSRAGGALYAQASSRAATVAAKPQAPSAAPATS